MCDDAIAALRTVQESFENRPRNTSLAYGKKAQEFATWCTQVICYPDGATVTGDKLHRFLKEQVCDRKRRPKKRKHKHRNTGLQCDEDSEVIIGFFTLQTYKSAIIDLYMQQKALHMNHNEHPGLFPAVKLLMDGYKRGSEKRNKENYTDRGHGTILEGFLTLDDLQKMSTYFFEVNKHVAMRNHLMFLLPHFSLCRGENVRSVQLADLFSLKLDDEGY